MYEMVSNFLGFKFIENVKFYDVKLCIASLQKRNRIINTKTVKTVKYLVYLYKCFKISNVF